MPKYKHDCDDCGQMANISFPDGPAYCDAHARKHKAPGPYSMDDLLGLSWHERIRKYSPDFYRWSGMERVYGK